MIIIKTAEEIGDKQHLSRMLARLALLSYEMGDRETAVFTGQRALTLAQENHFKEVEILSLIYLGDIFVSEAAYEEAAQSYESALTLCDNLKLPHTALDAHAGLAHAALKLNKQDVAEQHLNIVLENLTASQLIGTGDRFKIFLNCYRVLCQLNEAKAEELIAEAYHALQEQAQKLSDPLQRDQFCHQVKTHKTIMNLYRQPTVPQALSVPEGEAYLERTLTSREMEIAHLIIEGKRNQQIAEELVISNHTVKRHISNIFNKLGITTRYEIIKLAHGNPDN